MVVATPPLVDASVLGTTPAPQHIVDRRTLPRGIGVAAAATVGAGTASGETAAERARGRLSKRGHSLLSDPPGGYGEAAVRADGRYAVMGSFYGTGGSFLVDLSDPANPTEVHASNPPRRRAIRT